MIEKRTITLCYRKLIDINSASAWDKLVFESAFQEFKMQAQLYNQDKKYNTFAQLLHHVKGAEQLHFLVSAATINYLKQLDSIIPDIANNIGKLFLKFEQFKFEIINAHVIDISKFIICINFYSEPLIWHDTIAPYLLLSKPNHIDRSDTLTEMVAIRPYLTIYSIK